MYNLDSRFAFVDVETTGSQVTSDRIIEIGILVVENGQEVTRLRSFLNPEKATIPPFIQRLTGISHQDLEGAPTFFSMREQLQDLLENAIFVAHNARFDYGFLKAEFERVGIHFKVPTLCTVKLSRSLYPRFKRHNLDEVIARSGITVENRHRAFDDAHALWKFVQYAQKEFNREFLDQKISMLIKGSVTPPQISEALLESFPECPGVYSFYGKEGEVLYIGKSVNLKERIHSHFRNSTESSKEMHIFNRVTHIEVEKTAGEFSALMLEAQRIKEHQPIYNRRLRRLKKLTVITKKEFENGYMGAEITYLETIDAEYADTILGVFRSKRQAENFMLELAQEHKLCRGLLGLEKIATKQACFLYQLDRCSGACVEAESLLRYNLRFMAAFEKSRIHRWPFGGPILVEEKDEAFIIDKWCIIGHGRLLEDQEPIFTPHSSTFDYDMYKILANHILRKKVHFKPFNTPII